MTAPAYVRQHNGSIVNSNSGTITLTTPPAAGGLLVVVASIYPGGSSTHGGIQCVPTGGSGIVVTERIDTIGATGIAVGVVGWTVEYATAPTAIVVSQINGVGGAYAQLVAIEVSGQAASYFDVAGSGAGTSMSAVASGMPDTTYAEDLVIGWMTREGTAGTITPVAGWTEIVELDEANASTQTLNAIYKQLSATGANDPAWTLSSSDVWLAGGIAIKGAGGGGDPVLSADGGTFTLTGGAVTLTYSGGAAAYTLVAESGTFILTGADALIDLAMAAGSGVFTLTGSDATFTYAAATGYTLVAESGSFSISGNNATFSYTVYQVPRRRAGNRRNYLIEGKRYTLNNKELEFVLNQLIRRKTK